MNTKVYLFIPAFFFSLASIGAQAIQTTSTCDVYQIVEERKLQPLNRLTIDHSTLGSASHQLFSLKYKEAWGMGSFSLSPLVNMEEYLNPNRELNVRIPIGILEAPIEIFVGFMFFINPWPTDTIHYSSRFLEQNSDRDITDSVRNPIMVFSFLSKGVDVAFYAFDLARELPPVKSLESWREPAPAALRLQKVAESAETSDGLHLLTYSDVLVTDWIQIQGHFLFKCELVDEMGI